MSMIHHLKAPVAAARAAAVTPGARADAAIGADTGARERIDPFGALRFDVHEALHVLSQRRRTGAAALNAPIDPAALKLRHADTRPFAVILSALRDPGRLLQAQGGEAHGFLLDLEGGLRPELARSFYQEVGGIVTGSLGQPRPAPRNGPQSLEHILRDIVAYVVFEARPDDGFGTRWAETLQAAGRTPLDFLLSTVSGAVLAAAGAEGGPGVDDAEGLLQMIAHAIGPTEVAGFAEYVAGDLAVRHRIGTGPGPGLAAAVTAAMGLAAFAGLTPEDAAACEAQFARSRIAGLIDDREPCGELLRRSVHLWLAEAGTGPRRALVEQVLSNAGWLGPWTAHGSIGADPLWQRLEQAPAASPGALAQGVARRMRVTFTDTFGADRDRDFGGLLALDEAYAIRPLRVMLLGPSTCGKTSFVTGVLHELLVNAGAVLGGRPVLMGDEVTRRYQSGGDVWCNGQDPGRTQEACVVYPMRLGDVDIEIVDHRGGLLNYASGAPMAGVTDGDDPLSPEDAEEMRETLRHAASGAGGLIVFLNTETLLGHIDSLRRGDRPAAEQLFRTVTAEIAAMATRLNAVEQNRSLENMPIAAVVNKADLIFQGDDFRAAYEGGRLFGDVPRGAFGLNDPRRAMIDWATRQPSATASAEVQTTVVRLIDALSPLLLEAHARSRRYEMFLTSSHAVVRGGVISGQGPRQVFVWMLDALLPSYVAQALERIEADEAELKRARKVGAALHRLALAARFDPASPMATVSRFVPGGRRAFDKNRRRALGDLCSLLAGYGIALDGDPARTGTPEIDAALDQFDRRLAHTAASIAAVRKRFADLKTDLART